MTASTRPTVIPLNCSPSRTTVEGPVGAAVVVTVTVGAGVGSGLSVGAGVGEGETVSGTSAEFPSVAEIPPNPCEDVGRKPESESGEEVGRKLIHAALTTLSEQCQPVTRIPEELAREAKDIRPLQPPQTFARAITSRNPMSAT
jgi:hypothetical protein